MKANQKLTHAIGGLTVRETAQEGARLQITFTDGSILAIKLEDPASSVMLRDAAGALEYAD